MIKGVELNHNVVLTHSQLPQTKSHDWTLDNQKQLKKQNEK